MTDTLAKANLPVARPVDDGPVFHSLFRTGERSEPIAPVVNQLWNGQSTAAVFAPIAPLGPPDSRPLDLFQTSQPDVRSLFATKS